MKLDRLLSVDSMTPAAVTLTFDLVSMSMLRYRHDLIAVKLPPIITKILYSPFFQVIACCDLDL